MKIDLNDFNLPLVVRYHDEGGALAYRDYTVAIEKIVGDAAEGVILAAGDMHNFYRHYTIGETFSGWSISMPYWTFDGIDDEVESAYYASLSTEPETGVAETVSDFDAVFDAAPRVRIYQDADGNVTWRASDGVAVTILSHFEG